MRFGDISVKVCHDNTERYAYIYFRSYEEAREARHAKSRLFLFDKMVEIEPIYPDPPMPTSNSRRQNRSMTPDYNGPTQMNQRTSNLRTNQHQMTNSPQHPRNQRGPPIQQTHQSNPSMMKHHNNQYQRNYNQNNPMNNHHHQDHHNNNYSNMNQRNMNHHNQMHHQNHMRNDNYHLNNQNNHSNNQNSHLNHGNQNHHMRPQRESKKDKFPNYLHHIPPEDDDKATRFVLILALFLI